MYMYKGIKEAIQIYKYKYVCKSSYTLSYLCHVQTTMDNPSRHITQYIMT